VTTRNLQTPEHFNKQILKLGQYVLNIKIVLHTKHITTSNPQTRLELYLGTPLNTLYDWHEVASHSKGKNSYTIVGLGLNITRPTYRTSRTMIHQSICRERITRVHGMGANPPIPITPLFSWNMDSWVTTYLSRNPHIVVQKKHCRGPLGPSTPLICTLANLHVLNLLL
jgi:hypothetical protein